MLSVDITQKVKNTATVYIYIPVYRKPQWSIVTGFWIIGNIILQITFQCNYMYVYTACSLFIRLLNLTQLFMSSFHFLFQWLQPWPLMEDSTWRWSFRRSQWPRLRTFPYGSERSGNLGSSWSRRPRSPPTICWCIWTGESWSWKSASATRER